MRANTLRAGLAAAAILPLVAGGRFVAARTAPWPPPAIAVTSDAAHLASSVSVDALNATLLARLREFNSKPLRGHLDIFGKDSARAWDWTYLARSAARIYRINHDPRLVQGILEGFASYQADAQRHEMIDGYGWYTENTRTHSIYREVSITGLVAAPIIDLLLEAGFDRQLAELIGPKREALLDVIRRSLTGLDKMYLEEDGRGYFLLPSGGEIEPINLMSIFAAPLLGYWQLTSDPEALREATGIARTWKSVLRVDGEGAVSWPHTARPSFIHGPSNPMDFLYKAAAAIEFPLAAFRAGLVLDHKDIAAIAAAPATTLLYRVDAGHYWLRDVMQANLDSWVSYDPTDPSPALRPAAWYSYLCYDRKLALTLDPYLFGIDPKFYLKDGIALLGLADRLANDHDRPGCATGSQVAAEQSLPGQAALAGSPAGTSVTAAGVGTTRSTFR